MKVIYIISLIKSHRK